MVWKSSQDGLVRPFPIFPPFSGFSAQDLPWVPEAFHARFPVSGRSCLRPWAEDVSVFGRRSSSSHARKTSGTQGTQDLGAG